MSTKLIAILLLAAGCGGEGFDPVREATETVDAPICEATVAEACPCTDGDTGKRTCASDGSQWGACECVVKDPIANDPDVACDDQRDPSTFAAETCTEPRSRMFAVCAQQVVDSGVCAINYIGYYCCP